MPEESEVLSENNSRTSELLERVKACAARIISEEKEEDDIDIDRK